MLGKDADRAEGLAVIRLALGLKGSFPDKPRVSRAICVPVEILQNSVEAGASCEFPSAQSAAWKRIREAPIGPRKRGRVGTSEFINAKMAC